MPISPFSPFPAPSDQGRDDRPAHALLPGTDDRVVVVGSGRSGRAACRLLARRGCEVRLLEAKAESVTPQLREELEALGVTIETGPHRPEQFAGAAFVVPSPGAPLESILSAMGRDRDFPLESAEGPCILAETELAWRCLDGEKVIAVTGTSGKTTTVHLITAMLKEAGRTVFLGGNVGTPLSEYILSGEKADAVVLEISSFQLQTCLRLHPDVAVLMNISPNHLDYHRDMDEYVAAKMRLFACMTKDDLALVPEEWLDVYHAAGFAAPTLSPAACGRFPKTRLFGAHNALNAEIAWQAVRRFGVSEEAAARAVAGFAPLPHRLEYVAEKGGVLYLNDSKCTTVSSLETALKAMDRPVLLLCGGRWKGGDLEALIPLVREKVRLVAGFGESEEVFTPAWKDVVPMRWFPELESAMRWLHGEAREGDVMLLSPATASFDLYRGMAFRGQHFKDIVGTFQ
ncbi:MAG: UDP-N-acetylmuramoyl-L-alanine--D-glutamate ligase [Desulfovibrionaceae bacterium]|nr:UDP-N-acetylmuramoyl-L-alanine--D-glutamate ligase [Desulfovibrionaceae bacterium]